VTRLSFPRAQDPAAFQFLREKAAWTDEKSIWRDAIMQDYRIIMLVGDSMRDFLSADDVGKLAAGRQYLDQFAQSMLGLQWFVVPNPMYGSWQCRLINPDRPMQGMYDTLNTVNLGGFVARASSTTPASLCCMSFEAWSDSCSRGHVHPVGKF
jgi:hypothetical protein